MTEHRTAVPHLPATCAACYALCSPAEQRIADVVRKLFVKQPINDAKFFIPARTPLCEQEKLDG